MLAIKLDSISMEDYLLKIKSYVDELVGVGVLLRHEGHIDAILEGLSSDFSPVVSVIECKKHTPSIGQDKASLFLKGNTSLIYSEIGKLGSKTNE